jgi:hypothetical protein
MTTQENTKEQNHNINQAIACGAVLGKDGAVTFGPQELGSFIASLEKKATLKVDLPEGVKSILLRTEANGDCC